MVVTIVVTIVVAIVVVVVERMYWSLRRFDRFDAFQSIIDATPEELCSN